MGCDSNKQKPLENKEQLKIKEKETKKNFEAKIVLIGEQNVGKSSIAQRFCKNSFSSQHVATIGGAYLRQKVQLKNGECINLHIWDTGGQERFRAMTALYYKDAAAAILTYDVTTQNTLESLDYWIKELKNNASSENIILCLAGNKCDVNPNERKLQFNDGKIFASKNDMIFFETSAKNDIGIKELFSALAQKIYDIKFKE
jgi:small GTP-binding protein